MHQIHAYFLKDKVTSRVKVRLKVKKKHRFHIFGPRVGKTSRKELELTEHSVIPPEKVMHEYESYTWKGKVKVTKPYL